MAPKHASPGTGPLVVLALAAHVGTLFFLSLVPVFVHQWRWTPEALRGAVSLWDAVHYLTIAQEGYSEPHLAVYLPLYPALVSVLRFVTGDTVWAALAVSLVAHVAACLALYRLTGLDEPADVAWRSVVSLLAFPTAAAAVLPYTESLALALTLHAVLALRRGRLVGAGTLAGLATLTRLPSLALVPLFAVELALARERPAAPRVAAALGLPLAAVGLYLGLNAVVYGDPLFFLEVQEFNFSKGLAWPWVGMNAAWESLQRTPPEHITVGFSDLLGGGLAWAAALYAFARLRASYAAFALATAVLITCQSWWQSNLRYCLVLFPLHLMIARLTRHSWLATLLLVAGLVFQALLSMQFAKGSWSF